MNIKVLDIGFYMKYYSFLGSRVHITPCLHHFRLVLASVLSQFRQWLVGDSLLVTGDSLLVTEKFLLVTEDSLLVTDRTFNHL